MRVGRVNPGGQLSKIKNKKRIFQSPHELNPVNEKL